MAGSFGVNATGEARKAGGFEVFRFILQVFGKGC